MCETNKQKDEHKCPHCGSEKITLKDHDILACYYHKEDAEQAEYFLDDEVYATVICWDCNKTFHAYSKVTYSFSK